MHRRQQQAHDTYLALLYCTDDPESCAEHHEIQSLDDGEDRWMDRSFGSVGLT